MTLYQSDERIDALEDFQVSRANRLNHIKRYEFAAAQINSYFRRKIRILDAACGTGYGSSMLSSLCHSPVVGVDIDSLAIKNANQKYAQNKQVIFRQADLSSQLKFTQPFQAIVSFETIEHVSLSMGLKIISNFYHSLEPGGLLILSSPNRYISNLLKIIGIVNPFHIHEYYPHELSQILNKKNFKNLKFYGQALSFPPTFYLAAKNVIPPSYFYPSAKLNPLFTNNFIITGIK